MRSITGVIISDPKRCRSVFLRFVRRSRRRARFGARARWKRACRNWKLASRFRVRAMPSGLRERAGRSRFLRSQSDRREAFRRAWDARAFAFSRWRRLANGPAIRFFIPVRASKFWRARKSRAAFGLFIPARRRSSKLRAPLWIAEIDWEALAKLSRPADSVAGVQGLVPSFPSIERDFALVVKSDVTADKITQVALKAGKPLAKVAKIFDIYQGFSGRQGMTSVAVRVIFYEESRSLQESEAEAASAQISKHGRKSWALSCEAKLNQV